ncbi:MAG: hypothetical protein JKY93_07660, partial [Gammaproteobacteria bacterium]|nr:hypothetical protein [Gammaproteobacteria bacterium]
SFLSQDDLIISNIYYGFGMLIAEIIASILVVLALIGFFALVFWMVEKIIYSIYSDKKKAKNKAEKITLILFVVGFISVVLLSISSEAVKEAREKSIKTLPEMIIVK